MMSPEWGAHQPQKYAKLPSFAKAKTNQWWMGYLRASLSAYDPNSLKRIRRRKIQLAKSQKEDSLWKLLFVRSWMLVVWQAAIKSNGLPNQDASTAVIDRNSFWLCWFEISVARASSPIRITGIAPLRPFCGAFLAFVAIILKWEKNAIWNKRLKHFHFRDESKMRLLLCLITILMWWMFSITVAITWKQNYFTTLYLWNVKKWEKFQNPLVKKQGNCSYLR